MSRLASREPWGMRLTAVGRPRLRLLWFYHAGGSTAALAGWPRRLPEDWEVCVAEYPGRGGRRNEPSLSSVQEIARHFSERILLEPSELATVIFGHSMGALVAFELLHRLTDERRRAVTLLIISAMRGPMLHQPNGARTPLTDDGLLREVARLGATPAEVLQDDGLRELVLRNLRTDYAALNEYVYTRRRPLDIPMICFGGDSDPLAPSEQLAAWRAEAGDSWRQQLFRGGHFYYQDDPARFVAALRIAVEAALERRDAHG